MAKRRTIREYVPSNTIMKGVVDYPAHRNDPTAFFSEIPDLKQHIKDLQRMLENAKAAGYKNITVSLETRRIPYDDYYEIQGEITGERFETAAERRKREDRAAKAAESRKRNKAAAAKRKEAKDRAEYERLKEKYG